MDSKVIDEIDRQITALKKELGVLIQKRIAALEQEIRRSEAEAQALNAGSTSASSKSPKQAKAKAGRTPKPLDINDPITEPAIAAAPPEPAPQAAEEPETAPPSSEGKKRSRTAPEEAEKRLIEALKEAGLFGLTLAEMSEKCGLSAQASQRALKELPQVVRKGSGKEGRYYLKG